MKTRDPRFSGNLSRINWERQITKSEVRECEKCGNRYLNMARHKGECYMCKRLAIPRTVPTIPAYKLIHNT